MSLKSISSNLDNSDFINQEIQRLSDIKINETTRLLGMGLSIILWIFIFILGALIAVIIMFIIMFTLGTLFALINGIITGNFAYAGNMDLLGIIFPIVGFFCMIYGNYKIIEIKEKLNVVYILQKEIISIYENLKNTLNVIENIEQIESHIQSIYIKSQTVKRLLYFRFFFTENGKDNLQKLGILAIHIAISILKNLRSDLSIRLIEQQSTLESAKSEVEKNIQGTAELEQVSELQGARLDKQIEQFKELQRVLVRV